MLPPPPNEAELLVKEEVPRRSVSAPANTIVVKATIESSEDDSDDQQEEDAVFPTNNITHIPTVITQQASEEGPICSKTEDEEVPVLIGMNHSLDIIVSDNDDSAEKTKVEAAVKEIDALETSSVSESVPEIITEPVAQISNEDTGETTENKSEKETHSNKSVSSEINCPDISEDAIQNHRASTDSSGAIAWNMKMANMRNRNSVDSRSISNGSLGMEREADKSIDDVSGTQTEQQVSAIVDTVISTEAMEEKEPLHPLPDDTQDMPNSNMNVVSMRNSVGSRSISNGSVKEKEVDKYIDDVSGTLNEQQVSAISIITTEAVEEKEEVRPLLNDTKDIPDSNDVNVNPPMPAPRTVSPISEVSIFCAVEIYLMLEWDTKYSYYSTFHYFFLCFTC